MKILHRSTGEPLWEGEADTILDALRKALKAKANLSGAHLSGAHLSGANLSEAHLSWADLSRANLSRANLSGAHLSWADLSRAHLSGANLSWADLSGAQLSGAHLSGANLSRADLSGADLSGADLSGADLSGAHLSRAVGVAPERSTPLLLLRDQPGAIRLYKLVTPDGIGPFNGGISYEVGQSYSVTNANVDVMEQCAAGINVATLDWCLANWQSGYRVLIVEFTAADIAAIPTCTDGKIRLHRCSVVGEKDLAGLVGEK